MRTIGKGPGLKSSITPLLGGIALCLGLCVACDSAGTEAVPRVARFEKNDEAVRFVRSLREGMNSGGVPPTADVQRLKALALQYPGEEFIEEIHLSILQGLGDWEGIATYFEAKQELTEEERFTLTRAYLQLANYAGARDAIEALSTAHGTSVEANLLLGRAHYFLGQYDQAVTAYDRVWQQILSQGHTADIAYRAMIHLDRGETAQALALLNGALKANPNSVPVLSSLSRVLASLGRLEEAEVHSATVARLQDAYSQGTAYKERRASRVFALNKALGAGDIAGCERMVFDFLPDADEGFADELFRYLEKIYRLTNRDAELTDVLQRARSARRGE